MLTKSTHAKNVQCDSITGLLDGGSGAPSGSLRIFTSDSTELVSLHLSYPAFFPSVDGTALADDITDNTNVATGTATNFGFYNRDSTFVWGGSVSTLGGGGDMQISSTSLIADETTSIFPAYYVVQ
jgi:hypothetical protein